MPRLKTALAAGAISLFAMAPMTLAQTKSVDPITTCATPSGKAEPATPPDRTSADGTAPGNAGSTGWTGGTGGVQIGTNPQGATEHSQTWQPPTARGLDLTMTPPEKPADNKAC
ncbi:MAG: hypothetical protein BGO05_23360 [Rhizobiales bacterium 63-7]|nr:MAG: hypothetical protein BGO05_23360 [Rhizobiales bacterium 63-7]